MNIGFYIFLVRNLEAQGKLSSSPPFSGSGISGGTTYSAPPNSRPQVFNHAANELGTVALDWMVEGGGGGVGDGLDGWGMGVGAG